MDWLIANKEWLFSGVAVAIPIAIFEFFRRRESAKKNTDNNSYGVINNVVIAGGADSPRLAEAPSSSSQDVLEAGKMSDSDILRVKDSTRILFIDDDVKFKVVKILKNAGWPKVELVKDISALTDPVVSLADIIFVDIQGVGASLGFKDEGLGLANAIKDRYPSKKVVIYSAEPKGAMFHKALRKADDAIEKNADPYEFERMISGFVGII